MARNVATVVENNFVLGLITERTELRFPQNASTDIDNCEIDLYGRISRRKGLDFEDNYLTCSVTASAGSINTAYTEYLWEGSGGTSEFTLLIVQNGGTLIFFDTSSSTDVGPNKILSTITLSSYQPAGSTVDVNSSVCDFAAGNGKLFVVSDAIDPIYLSFVGGLVTATKIPVQTRDFEGLDDGLSLITRPTESVSSLNTNNPNHYYNILNQGWYSGDALSQWDTARTDMPSNADQVGLFRASTTDAFDNAIVTSRTPGNVSAPKGHFILDAFNPNRAAAALNEGFTVALATLPEVNRALGSNIGTMTNLGDAFDANITTAATSGSDLRYVGKDFSTPGATKIAASSFTFSFTSSNTTTFELRASNTIPAVYNDGTLLGSSTINTTGNTKILVNIGSNDTVTTWKYFWITYKTNRTNNTMSIWDLHFYNGIPALDQIVYNRPQAVSFFQGRAFYSGVNSSKLSAKIFFSRIIENDKHYGQCYSDNDPTSETFNDFLPSDGGVISIPDCGTVTRMFPTQNSLLILATNGIWVIGGASGAPFQASNYTVSKLSSIGTQCPRSVVDYKGTPIWWGDNGIYTVQYDPNFNSYTVIDITQDNIRTFFNEINADSRRITKGAYDIEEDKIYFLYQDIADTSTVLSNVYNRVLVFSPRAKAFFPWTFEDSPFNIRGIIYVRSASRTDEPVVKYLSTDVALDTSLYFSEIKNTSYKDWTTYATVISHNPLDEINYTSYFTVGHYIHGETQRFFQGNYLFVFLDQDSQGSIFVQTFYDWTVSGNSGKWGSKQQAYPDWQTLQSVNYRRLKTRGKGRAMQLYFESEEGKPFSVIGWSIFESGNAGI